jgi:endonuclease YncB( thermonuclease family)
MGKVIPHRRRASPGPWTRVSDYGGSPRGGTGQGFPALLIVLMLGVFCAVFFWEGPPGPVGPTGIEPGTNVDTHDVETLRRERWPTSVSDLDGAQPLARAPTTARTPTPGTAVTASFGRCGAASRAACVVDGDTIWLAGTKIRMADFNTPEVSRPGCAYERQLGERATARLLALLNSGAVTVTPNPEGRDHDRYGRALRIVRVDGASVGDTLVAEGLAEPWRGYRRDWC